MAMRANPYQADAGPYNAIGQGVNNLAQAFLGGQADPLRQAQAEQAAWTARARREQVLDAERSRDGQTRLGDMLMDFDPAGDHRALWAQGVGSGALEVDDLAALQRGMLANFGGDDAQLARAFAGAGDAIGVNDAFSLAGRDQVASRNLGHNIARDQATPSLDQALGMAFAGGDMSLAEITRQQHPQRFAQAGYYNAQAGQVGQPESRDEVLAHLFMTQGPEAAGEARPVLYGAGSGDGGNPTLDATRRASLEEEAYTALYEGLADMGVTEEQYNLLDDALVSQILSGAVDATLGGGTPRAYVREQLAGLSFDPGAESSLIRPWTWGESREPSLAPRGAAAPVARPDTPRHNDPNLAAAADAVARGADPRAVRERLMQNGYTDSQIVEAGL